jgi:hypothetical protein
MALTDLHNVQIPRKIAYEKSHADTHIIYMGTFWQSIKTEPGGVTVISRDGLEELMDKLETL